MIEIDEDLNIHEYKYAQIECWEEESNEDGTYDLIIRRCIKSNLDGEADDNNRN